MAQSKDKQQQKSLDPVVLFADARRLGIKQKRIAARIRRTPQAVSKAFQGQLPTVLRKIFRLIEKEKARRAA